MSPKGDFPVGDTRWWVSTGFRQAQPPAQPPGGRGQRLGAEKTRSQPAEGGDHPGKNARKWRRLGEGAVHRDHRPPKRMSAGDLHLPKRSEGVHHPGARPGRFVRRVAYDRQD